MRVTSDYLAALVTTYQTDYARAWNEFANHEVLKTLAQRIPSTTLNETVSIPGAASDGPRDVTTGQVEFQDSKHYSQTIVNRTWQDGFETQREAFDDDRHKLDANRPSELAAGALAHVGELIGDLYETGTSDLAYDGIAFFADTRATGTVGGAHDNLLSATGTYTTAANIYTDIRAGQLAFMDFTNDKGKVLGIRGNTIVLPSELYDEFFSGLTFNSATMPPADQLAPQADSFSVGGYKVVLNRRLSSATAWYLLHVDPARGRFPFVWTDRASPKLEGTTSVDSYEWRVQRKAIYTTYGRYEAAFGNPLYAVKFA